ncbi:MAG: hypothetical protein IPN02_05015 [Candidatus Microthrix sp.]|uniref:Uncharacterized protein n=1 Tax=Candidatus Neomicrothrix subdominans TaxID=2954438 RepID=A0A936N9P3_9ACTN|nr:hypothetical protein [Candidatus Microthrix subdominans]
MAADVGVTRSRTLRQRSDRAVGSQAGPLGNDSTVTFPSASVMTKSSCTSVVGGSGANKAQFWLRLTASPVLYTHFGMCRVIGASGKA